MVARGAGSPWGCPGLPLSARPAGGGGGGQPPGVVKQHESFRAPLIPATVQCSQQGVPIKDLLACRAPCKGISGVKGITFNTRCVIKQLFDDMGCS